MSRNDADCPDVVARVVAWFDGAARDLPWRRRGTTPWGVLVSEFMTQQTPVARVVEPWSRWLDRWPTPAALAAATPGDAVREWGRLGYPRRALRLHQSAQVILERHDGRVPDEVDALRALPGVGDYTAGAVMAFAFGRRAVVLDTNVRRVLARVVSGRPWPAPSLTAAERAEAEAILPPGDEPAARWSVAAMELGALICTARAPRCSDCPIEDLCRWRSLGQPGDPSPRRRAQPYAGTDRQARGALLDVLRQADRGAVRVTELAAAWPPAEQRARALAGLIADGLVEAAGSSRVRLPE